MLDFYSAEFTRGKDKASTQISQFLSFTLKHEGTTTAADDAFAADDYINRLVLPRRTV